MSQVTPKYSVGDLLVVENNIGSKYYKKTIIKITSIYSTDKNKTLKYKYKEYNLQMQLISPTGGWRYCEIIDGDFEDFKVTPLDDELRAFIL